MWIRNYFSFTCSLIVVLCIYLLIVCKCGLLI